MAELKVALLGTMDYGEALNIQENLLELRQQGEITDMMLLLEHPPVLTIGRSGSVSNVLLSEDVLKAQGITVYEVNRGGDVTYHGPGQIVGYPILDLNDHGKDVRSFFRRIEQTFINLLGDEYGIDAGRDPKYPGVWVGDEKITAIGCAVKRWVTMHGFAFNINTNLDHFKWINPCGITDKGVTSLERILGHPEDMDKVNKMVITHFSRLFNLEPRIIDKGQLYEYMRRDIHGDNQA